MKKRKKTSEPASSAVTEEKATAAEAERMVRLAAEGVIIPGSGVLPDGFWELERPADPRGTVLRALLEERESDR